jgi:predicted transcriptional regulator
MCKPLHIEYGARLTYRQTFGYVTSLVESGFLLKKKTKSGPYQYYEITDKGRRYLQVFAELEDNLRPVVSRGTLLTKT